MFNGHVFGYIMNVNAGELVKLLRKIMSRKGSVADYVVVVDK